MNREQIGAVGGDCTAPYKVEIDSDMTLKDFVQCVLAQYPKEWGYIGIKSGNSIFGEPKIEYSKGIIKTENFDAEIKRKKVVSAYASGGWSRMDYLLTLED